MYFTRASVDPGFLGCARLERRVEDHSHSQFWKVLVCVKLLFRLASAILQNVFPFFFCWQGPSRNSYRSIPPDLF
jgi:hypothetical protein